MTIIPASMTNPIIATTLISFPVKNRANRPPVNASGIVNMMMNGDRNDWNCATMIR